MWLPKVLRFSILPLTALIVGCAAPHWAETTPSSRPSHVWSSGEPISWPMDYGMGPLVLCPEFPTPIPEYIIRRKTGRIND
jgi:hypothetical protein